MKTKFLLLVVFNCYVLLSFSQLNLEWSKRIGGGNGRSEIPGGIFIGESGNIYLSSFINKGDSIGYYARVYKYSTTGEQLWSKEWNLEVHNSINNTSISSDDSGFLYLLVKTIWNGIAIVKYDQNGNEISSYSLNALKDASWTISNNAFYFLRKGEINNYAPRVYKYSLEMEPLWNTSLSNATYVNAITFDEDGNVYLTGTSNLTYNPFTGEYSGGDLYAGKMSLDGQIIWENNYATETYYESGRAIVIDGENQVYITGIKEDPFVDYDVLTVSFDENGTQRWVNIYEENDSSLKLGNQIKITPNNTVIIQAYELGINDSSNIINFAYNQDGAFLWEKNHYVNTRYDLKPTSMQVDEHGNVYNCGFWNALPGPQSAYVNAFNYSNNTFCENYYLSTPEANEKVRKMRLDGTGGIYLLISSDTSSYSGNEVLLRKFNHPLSINNKENIKSEKYLVYPNPVTKTSILDLNNPTHKKLNVEFISIEGRTIKSISTNKEQLIISITEFEEGINFFVVSDGSKRLGIGKFIVKYK